MGGKPREGQILSVRKPWLAEKKAGSKWKFVGLEVEWDPLEALFGRVDLTPQLAGRASRSAIPVYRKDRHIGQMTSHTFSPILKKYIAIGTIESPHAHYGDEVELEFTVEYVRHKVQSPDRQTPLLRSTPESERDTCQINSTQS